MDDDVRIRREREQRTPSPRTVTVSARMSAPFRFLCGAMLSGQIHRPVKGQLQPSWITEKNAPCGSWIAAKRPTFGTSIGPKQTFPPSDSAFFAVASQLATWK